jgi:D-glycero-alpha-D-manno-heptose-7-phosphate kinase
VAVRQLRLDPHLVATLVANMHLYYTNVQHKTTEVLVDQDKAMREPAGADRGRVEESLLGIKEIGYDIRDAILGGNFDQFGRLLDDHWRLKRQLSKKVEVEGIDELYEQAKKEFGVLGGKIAGAGGGGFLVLYAPSRHQELTAFMRSRGLMRLPYNVEFEGSKVITNVFNTQMLAIHRDELA